MGEVLFAVFIALLGLVLFALLISNIQKYLQSSTSTVRVEQMRINRRDAENWMAHRMLPKKLRQRIRRYDQYKWQLNRGVKEDELINNFPIDLRRDIKRHLHFDACLAILKRVPFFSSMDTRLLEVMYEYLKPVLFTEHSTILQNGDPIVMMLFIVKGKLAVSDWENRSYTVVLKAGDFYGEEIIPWALEAHPTSLPISTRTIKSLTKVEAFALEAKQLQSVASQFYLQYLDGKQSMRLYSREWRVWAACKVQEAWLKYCERKQKRGGGDRRFQDALAKTVGASASSGATLYGSIFISHLLQAVHRDRHQETTQLSRKMTLLPPPKPDERDKLDHTILDL